MSNFVLTIIQLKQDKYYVVQVSMKDRINVLIRLASAFLDNAEFSSDLITVHKTFQSALTIDGSLKDIPISIRVPKRTLVDKTEVIMLS